jgi:hypothetical protein
MLGLAGGIRPAPAVAAPGAPTIALAADGWHVNASLSGVDRFVFVVKVARRPDAYFGDQASPFAVDRGRFGGRSVSVSARADGPKSNPWATPALRFKWADYGADNMWGVVRPDGSHRPSYDAYRSGTAS